MPPGPAENGEVGHRQRPGDELGLGQAAVQHAVQPPGLLHVALQAIALVVAVHRQEVVHLPRHRPEPAHLPHQPFQHRHPAAQVRGQELAGLLAEVQQDGARLEDRDRAAAGAFRVDDGGDLVVGADGEEGRGELLVLGDVHNLDLVGQPHLLQRHADLAAVRRVVGVQLDHRRLPDGGRTLGCRGRASKAAAWPGDCRPKGKRPEP